MAFIGPAASDTRSNRARALIWFSAPALLTLLGCSASLTTNSDDAAAGKGGAGGIAGAGGIPTQGSGGFGNHPCPPKPETVCTEPGAPPMDGLAFRSCDREGNICAGGDLGGDGSGCYLLTWSQQCCSGYWTRTVIGPGGDPVACPTAGTPFSCDANSGLSCTIGQTACAQSFDLATSRRTFACANLCPAADCSCFCTPDAQGGCQYSVDDPLQRNNCQCGVVRGSVVTSCTHGMEPPYGCMRDPSTDATCSVVYPQAFTCVPSDIDPVQTQQRSGCQQLDDDPPNHWCCWTD
ncbi:MAG TPA: hypothetical protein VIF57_00040 [Polyangia bacterium]|jgi:hypothetical protein